MSPAAWATGRAGDRMRYSSRSHCEASRKKKKRLRPPGLSLLARTSGFDSRQCTEHLRHHPDGLALPVDPLQQLVRRLIRVRLELLGIPARTQRLRELRRRRVVVLRAVFAHIEETRLS